MTPSEIVVEYERRLRFLSDARAKLARAERAAQDNKVTYFADLAAKSLPKLRAALAAAETAFDEIAALKSAQRTGALQPINFGESWPPKPVIMSSDEFRRRYPHWPALEPGEEDLPIPAFLRRAPATAKEARHA